MGKENRDLTRTRAVHDQSTAEAMEWCRDETVPHKERLWKAIDKLAEDPRMEIFTMLARWAMIELEIRIEDERLSELDPTE